MGWGSGFKGKNEYADFSFKAVILGAEGVGRSAFLKRLITDTYQPDVPPTIGVECVTYTARIRKRKVRALLFDTSGQKRYAEARGVCYPKAAGAIVLFDVTNTKSFQDIDGIIKEFHRIQGNEYKIILICGTKIDDVENRSVSEEEGRNRARELGINGHVQYAECSAKNAEDSSVRDAFAKFTASVCENGGPLVYCARCARGKTGEEPCI